MVGAAGLAGMELCSIWISSPFFVGFLKGGGKGGLSHSFYEILTILSVYIYKDAPLFVCFCF